MPQLLLALFLFGLAVVAIKVAFLLLILAGLIFRTQATLSLLLCGAVYMLFRNHTLAAVSGAAALGALYLWSHKRNKRRQKAAERLPAPSD